MNNIKKHKRLIAAIVVILLAVLVNYTALYDTHNILKKLEQEKA